MKKLNIFTIPVILLLASCEYVPSTNYEFESIDGKILIISCSPIDKNSDALIIIKQHNRCVTQKEQ